MEKKKKGTLLLMVLLLLIGITALYVASTYAKYTSDITGKKGEAIIAKWNFDTENEEVTMDIDYTKTYDPNTLTASRIAPGTEGEFSIELSKTTSETGVDYTISFGEASNVTDSFKFYDEENNVIDITSDTLTGTINIGATETIIIKWVWTYEVDETQNGKDTVLGKAGGASGEKLTLPITIKGVQTQPTETTTTP